MPECIRTVGRARCPRVIGARDKRLSSKVLRTRQHRRRLAARVQVSAVMTRATRVTIFILSVSLAPCVARAQDQAQTTPQGNPERKETGLPSKIKWPFNLDAGWGTFGFGN